MCAAWRSTGWAADITNLAAEPFASGPPRARPRRGRRIPVQPSPGARAGRGRIDAGRRPAVRTRHGVRRRRAASGAGQTIPAPLTAAAEANARLSAQINSMLCAARFAHLLKVMGRDMVGSSRTADEIERQLNRWLQDYVNTNINSTSELRARFPLVEGNVQVRERPGKPGAFGCTIHLRPHYQLDDVVGRLPRRDRTRRHPAAYRGGSMSTFVRKPGKPAACSGEGNLGRRPDGGQCRGSQDDRPTSAPAVLLAELLVFAGNIERADSFSMPAPTSTRRRPWW